MKIASPDVIIGDHPVMKKAMKVTERLCKAHGREEGLTLTSGKNGVHSAGSWHYYGAAGDIRTNHDRKQYWESGNYHNYPPESTVWDRDERLAVYAELKSALPGYDVCWHESHIHLEPGDALARKWNLLL